jgi:hypothetical protein
MGYYALFYREVVPDFITQRGAYREEHLGLAREAHSRGELVLAGALADPPDGALPQRRRNARTRVCPQRSLCPQRPGKALGNSAVERSCRKPIGVSLG